MGDVGLDRAEVGAAVEDDGERVRERQAVDLQRDGDRGLGVDERTAQEVVGVVLRVWAVLLVHRPSSLVPA